MCSVSFFYGIIAVSLLSTKAVHLYHHVNTIPVAALLGFMPTFFLYDFLVLFVARLVMQQSKKPLAIVGSILGAVFAMIALCGASSQLGFFFKTGGELQWRDGKAYASDLEALKVLLSGSAAVLASAAVILVITFVTQGVLYRLTGDFLEAVSNGIARSFRFILPHAVRGARLAYAKVSSRIKLGRGRYFLLADNESDDASVTMSDLSSGLDSSESHSFLGYNEKSLALEDDPDTTPRQRLMRKIYGALTAMVMLYFIVAFAIRPIKPYKFLSVTLPWSMLDVFKGEPDFCSERRDILDNNWPLPQLIDKSFHEEPKGLFKGWAPGINSTLADKYMNWTPDWVPKSLPRGFFRFDPERFEKGYMGSYADNDPARHTCRDVEEHDPYYNPVRDPMKISNLDNDILEPLQEALGNGSVKIKNVVLVLMESLRGDLFPLQEGSDIFNMILNANDDSQLAEVKRQLARLTPHIEKLTGLSSNILDKDGKPFPEPELLWDDKTRQGFGGVNVRGAYTTATMSTKSFCANNCGAWPMAVESFHEADTDSYQPCLPQIVELFNRAKVDSGAPFSNDSDAFQDHEWTSALFEAELEQYDRQDVFDQKLGFQKIYTKKEIESDPWFNATNPRPPMVNYFGYPEPILKPRLTEYIRNAAENNQRFFMSHFTSTTHHAWDTPEDFETIPYLPTDGMSSWHKNFNKYINTIRYHDAWMGQLMQLFDDLGISNETLVVFAGDHGQTFKEDANKLGTYEINHISDFHVPITIRHPNLPRVQYHANATTISILPTVLDLLIHSGSLNEQAKAIASDLVQDYEGQSLIRPYQASKNGRRAWNFAVINSGSGMLVVTSADVMWKLSMPLDKVFEYQVTDLMSDPTEKKPAKAWDVHGLLTEVHNAFGDEARTWANEAVEVARWWRKERKRLWRFHT